MLHFASDAHRSRFLGLMDELSSQSKLRLEDYEAQLTVQYENEVRPATSGFRALKQRALLCSTRRAGSG